MALTPENKSNPEKTVIGIITAQYRTEDGQEFESEIITPGKYLVTVSYDLPDPNISKDDSQINFRVLHYSVLSTNYKLEPVSSPYCTEELTNEQSSAEFVMDVKTHIVYGDITLPVNLCSSNILIYSGNGLIKLFNTSFKVVPE